MSAENCIYILADKADKIKDMDARYLLTYLVKDGFANYLSYEEAESGRQDGDAYDKPGLTRVIGFRITPFVPKKKKKGKANEKLHSV